MPNEELSGPLSWPKNEELSGPLNYPKTEGKAPNLWQYHGGPSQEQPEDPDDVPIVDSPAVVEAEVAEPSFVATEEVFANPESTEPRLIAPLRRDVAESLRDGEDGKDEEDGEEEGDEEGEEEEVAGPPAERPKSKFRETRLTPEAQDKIFGVDDRDILGESDTGEVGFSGLLGVTKEDIMGKVPRKRPMRRGRRSVRSTPIPSSLGSVR